MKQTSVILAACCFLLLFNQGCKKGDASLVVNPTIKTTDAYQYDLGSFGDEEGGYINKQALHYSASKTERAGSKIVYTYVPALGYIGTDEVELLSARGSNGTSANTNVTVTTIKFTVTN